MDSEETISSIRELITYLNDRPKLSAEEARDRFRAYFSRAFSQMVKTGDSCGVVTGVPGTVMATANEAEFRSRLRATDNDLGEQVRIVTEGVRHYFENGEYPPPYYAWRIAVILRAAKQYALELEFLEAYGAKFSDGNGRLYRDITDRMQKARVLARRLA